MKISWGYKIAMLYVGFVLLILSLVIGSMRQKVDLVAKDYYQQELAYQEVIDASRNRQELTAPVAIEITQESVRVRFPDDFNGQTISAQLAFYAPSDASFDRSFHITGDTVMPVKLFAAPFYKVKLRWQSAGREYYQETAINL